MAAIQGTGISKKIIGFLKTLHIVSLLASGSVVYAQEDQFNLGFLFNVNMHSSVGENNEFWNSGERSWPSISTSEGIFVNRNLSKHTYGNIEFRYIQKGSNNTINDRWVRLSLNYIEVPISFGYKYQTFDNNIYFEAGFAYACLINSKVTSGIRKHNTTEVDSTDISAIRNSGISMQIAVKKPLNPKYKDNLFLAFRFSYSMSSFSDIYQIYSLNYGFEIDYIIKGKEY